MESTSTAGPGRPPGIRTNEAGLTDRQSRIIEHIAATVRRQGYPPSMREIGQAVGLSSTSSVAHQLLALERKGFLFRDPHTPRAYRVTAAPEITTTADACSPVHVPVVGRIAAGTPILAQEAIEDVLALPRELVGEGELFALTVTGDSMIGAHILSGDKVVLRSQPNAENGEIVAAMIEGEATIKRLSREGQDVWLLPANDAYAPIDGNRATILGKVTAVLRAL